MTTPTMPTGHPGALGDQIDAATRDARRLLARLADAGPGHMTAVTGGWLAEQGTVALAALRANGRTCAHLGPAPRVVHAAVWAPGLAVCTACVQALQPTPAEDATCDRCHRHARRLSAGAVAFGPLILAYGLCRSCATTTGLRPEPPARNRQPIRTVANRVRAGGWW
jgi:hypothetical protein